MPEALYLDYAATTPCDPQVAQAMLPYFGEQFGNPSSVHRWGQKAFGALENARRKIARVLACAPSELIFTSGGSESDNLALRGVLLSARAKGRTHLITCASEHKAVLATTLQLEKKFGVEVSVLPVNQDGRVTPAQVAEALRPQTALVSLAYANNEVGSIHPLAEIAEICHARGVLLHSDAVQAGAQLPLEISQLGVDLLSLGAHKFYGPKGVGILFCRNGIKLTSSQTGGAQEDNRRAGTQNVPLIIGMAEALAIVAERRASDAAHFATLRDLLIREILTLPNARLTGAPTAERLPNHASFAFAGVDGNELLMRLDLAGIGASSGSACSTGNPEASHILLAMGYPQEWAKGALRLSVGRQTTYSQIEASLPRILACIRELS